MSIAKNSVMAANEAYKLVNITEVHKEDIEELKDVMDSINLDIKITYRSVYGNIKVWASNDKLIKI